MKEKMYSLTVIVPVYNTPIKLLEKCIQSILSQTGIGYELIIVDDGSLDETAKYLDTICGCNVRVLHKHHEGVSVARNIGIEMSEGDYIMFVDSDDFLEKDAFRRFKRYLTIEGADIIIGKTVRINSIEENCHKYIGHSYLLESEKDMSFLREMLFSKDSRMKIFGHQEGEYSLEGLHAKFMRRSAIGETRFNAELVISEDTVFNYILLKKKKLSVILVDNIIYAYVQNPVSVLHKYSPFMKERISRTLKMFEKEVLNDEKEIYLKYVDWKIRKFQQLIKSYYLAQENNENIVKVKNKLKQTSACDPWKFKKIKGISIKNKIKIGLIESGNMAIYMEIKGRLKKDFLKLRGGKQNED